MRKAESYEREARKLKYKLEDVRRRGRREEGREEREQRGGGEEKGVGRGERVERGEEGRGEEEQLEIDRLAYDRDRQYRQSGGKPPGLPATGLPPSGLPPSGLPPAQQTCSLPRGQGRARAGSMGRRQVGTQGARQGQAGLSKEAGGNMVAPGKGPEEQSRPCLGPGDHVQEVLLGHQEARQEGRQPRKGTKDPAKEEKAVLVEEGVPQTDDMKSVSEGREARSEDTTEGKVNEKAGDTAELAEKEGYSWGEGSDAGEDEETISNIYDDPVDLKNKTHLKQSSTLDNPKKPFSKNPAPSQFVRNGDVRKMFDDKDVQAKEEKVMSEFAEVEDNGPNAIYASINKATKRTKDMASDNVSTFV